jgi:hypothetical protein
MLSWYAYFIVPFFCSLILRKLWRMKVICDGNVYAVGLTGVLYIALLGAYLSVEFMINMLRSFSVWLLDHRTMLDSLRLPGLSSQSDISHFCRPDHLAQRRGHVFHIQQAYAPAPHDERYRDRILWFNGALDLDLHVHQRHLRRIRRDLHYIRARVHPLSGDRLGLPGPVLFAVPDDVLHRPRPHPTPSRPRCRICTTVCHEFP